MVEASGAWFPAVHAASRDMAGSTDRRRNADHRGLCVRSARVWGTGACDMSGYARAQRGRWEHRLSPKAIPMNDLALNAPGHLLDPPPHDAMRAARAAVDLGGP